MAARPLLIIDDDAALADLIASILAVDGYAVVAVTSASAARNLLATHGPAAYCLVMSDSFARPPDDLFPWLDELRTRTTAPVVIASAHPEALFQGWHERGFAGFLAKPFDIDDLSALVAAVCAGA